MNSWRRRVERWGSGFETYLGRFLLFCASLLLLIVIYSENSDGPEGWAAADWEAFAALVTAFVAVVAILVALYQLKEARELRWEQARPYVVGYLEPDAADPRAISLVVRNFGTTAATALELEIEPTPLRSGGVHGGQLRFPSTLPTLVPGQEWRTFWDLSAHRYQATLPSQHTLSLTFLDSRGEKHQETFLLDWDLFLDGRSWDRQELPSWDQG